MRERRVFRYNYGNIFHYIFCCVPCRTKKTLRHKPRFREHLYYKVGEEKLLEELDCVTMIKAIRQLRILTQVLLTKKQKFLIKFQRNNVIDSSSSGTSDEGQNNIVGIPPMPNPLCNQFIDLMKSKNEIHKSIIDSKIKKVVEGYKKKTLKDVDTRIISGTL